MASTLTTTQKITVCNILAIPYTVGFTTVDGTGNYVGQTAYSPTGAGNARIALFTSLDNLDSDAEAVLIEYITAYKAIELNTATIGGGSEGESYDPKQKKLAIENAVRNMLNYQELQNILNFKNSMTAAKPTFTIPIMH